VSAISWNWNFRRRRRGRAGVLRILALIGAVAGWSAGCTEGEPSLEQPDSVDGIELIEVVHPDLGAIESVAADQLRAARSELARALEGAEAVELGQKFGNLGRLYHGYGMVGPAAGAYANAELLNPQEASWPYLVALLSAESGEVSRAVAAFERVLALRPSDGPALIRLARARTLLGEPEAAIEGFRQAVEVGEKFAPAAHFGIGKALAAAGDHAGAVELLEEVLAAQPQAGAARYPLALSYRALGEAEKARGWLAGSSVGEVTFPDPGYELLRAAAGGAGALLRRGGEALMAGDLEGAVEAYRAATQAAPDDAEARRNLALALLRSGDVDAAIEQLRLGLERTPDNLWLRFDLGSALSASGEATLAIEELHRAIEQAPNFVAGHFNLANALIRAGRWGEAGAPLRRVLELDPRHTNARYLLAMRLQQQGQSGKAEHQLRQLLEDHPDHLPSQQGLAAMLISRGDAGGAVELYRQALERGITGPPAVEIHLALAEIEKRRNRPAAQQASYRAAIEAAPNSTRARLAWAAELSRQERWSQAAEQFAAAADLEPGNAAAHLGAAQTLAAAGDWPAALEALEAARQRLPEDLALTHALARLLAVAPEPAARDGLELAKIAYQAEPNIAHAETVAMAMAESGDFTGADEWISSLLKRVEESGGQRYVEVGRRLKEDRALYRRGEAVRREVLW